MANGQGIAPQSRILETPVLLTKLTVHWWVELDSDQRSENATVLQTVPFAAREPTHMEETVRFELTIPTRGMPVFKTGAINRTLPRFHM